MNALNLPAFNRKEYNRQYYWAHRERLLRRGGQYYRTNREAILEYQKQHSQKPHVVERRKELQKARRNLPSFKGYMKEYRKNNHKKIMAKNLEYWSKRENQPRRKFYRYRYNAQKRYIDFELSLAQFVEIINRPCFYCGTKDNLVNGVDRYNNSRGYVMGNVVSCCWDCNRMKGSLTEGEFLSKCQLIIEHMNAIRAGGVAK